ncbi:O-Antigen ligase [compost metagenome]
MIVMAIVFCAAWWIRKFPYRWIALPLTAWFVFYTVLSQIGMGMFTLSGIILVLFFFKVKSVRTLWLKRVFIASFGLIILFTGIFLYIKLQPVPHKMEISLSDYETKTVKGNQYTFDLMENMRWENGYPVHAFVVDSELEKEWSKVSDIPYENGLDPKGNPIRIILLRYMTSKGLKKDSVDFQQMTKRDILNVESGFASVEMAKGGLSAQLYRMRSQLNNSEDPNGKSLLEKIESLKAGLTIIKENPLTGVGIGDIKESFAKAYQQNQTKLTVENQHLTHNQFLTSWIVAGVVCFVVFCAFWFVQLITALRINALEWTGFLAITMLSFLIEDTLQTQTGICFVAFFFAFFITGRELMYGRTSKV